MAARAPSSPPALPGFSYLRPLGTGGFADVFLYEQNLPRRQVAIKVLLTEVVSDPVRRLFQAEANLMAQLSAHPSVLTVYQAGVSADGRPYLVMEYCSNALDGRYRSGRLPVSEVLRIGVTIASAVETAHRADVLHRDIKPSNILTTAYGHPVLSDFGIASTLGEAEHTDSVGLSIPWSAPEILQDENAGTVAAEVRSLGATLYSLLAGRSPFERPDESASPVQLISRITRDPLPPLGRSDVPARLELVLAKAMSKAPERRQASALELIRELQSVEAELGLTQTPVELATAQWEAQVAVAAADQTRITALLSVDAQPVRRQRRAPGQPRTVPTAPPSAAPARRPARPGRRSVLAFGAAGLFLAGAVTGGLVIGPVLAGAAPGAAAGLPRVSDVTGRSEDGTIVFSWADPGLSVGDNYIVTLGSGESSIQRGTEFTVQTGAGQSATGTTDAVCITVSVNRDGRTGPASTENCVDPVETAR